MTTQAGVALSEASPQRKPRPQRLRECHAVGAPAQARYPPGAKVVISAPLSRGSLFWLAGRRNHRPQCPHRKSPPPPKCREGLPLRAPLRDPGQGGKPTGEYPKLPYAAPRGRGILPRLPSVEFPPGPARGQTPSQLANIYPRQIAGLKASVAPRAHHVAGVPPPCQPPPLESAGSKPSSPPSGARRHPPSTWSACHSFAPMAVEPTG
ncbi:hypothetical protein N7447_011202 [Penicillium robsamsonii]|uniref:uncharacterized protein n=1 Tax=Penicillium robsamsonii TaxID=1792511 RepID=UPI00254850A2|nr:uncharacterized protein N7447_011202 [Penicillium robsamsonii]KAJ5807290.1 hypothetical protein N7447_011202 [Penicillium robsamsonii]